MNKQTDYAALVAMDWGDTTHSLAWQKTGEAELQHDTLPATPEALHEWFEKLREACEGRPVALAIEAGRNGLLHALFEHAAWLTIYPIHPAPARASAWPSRPPGRRTTRPTRR